MLDLIRPSAAAAAAVATARAAAKSEGSIYETQQSAAGLRHRIRCRVSPFYPTSQVQACPAVLPNACDGRVNKPIMFSPQLPPRPPPPPPPPGCELAVA